MGMFKRILVLLIVVAPFAKKAQSQELLCTVTILDNQIQLSDKSVFRRLEQTIANFMNTTRWTEEPFEQNERIECNIQIILSAYDPSSNRYSGSGQVQSRRPVFGSVYNTTVFNMNDENWNFVWNEFEPMAFNENSFTTSLVALLSFYAYYVIAMDFETFAPMGGTPYFNKALQIANNAQPNAGAGWQPFERNIRSRYNLIDNIINERFRPLREAMYTYHRKGLDQMLTNPEEARKAIIESLEQVQKVFKIAPNTVLLLVFFEAKSDELVNIFKGAPQNEKPKVIALLSETNVSNINKYEKIRQN
jgi:hypothetical protein